MEALIRFNQMFAVTQSLLDMHEMFSGLRTEALTDNLRLALCEYLGEPERAALHHAKNDRVFVAARAAVPIPQALILPGGLDSLLRQAVVASSTALESFFWNALVENIMIVLKARKAKSDESIRSLTMTLGDYMSIQEYEDPDIRVQQLILRNFERGTLYDATAIEKIAAALTIKDYWRQVEATCRHPASALKNTINELVRRRNQIVHRGDLPEDGEAPDAHGLRPINVAWVNQRVQAAKTLATATTTLIEGALERLKQDIKAAEEQEEARKLAIATAKQAAIVVPVVPVPVAAPQPPPA
jgi:HEPN superfamily RiboL-PSP-like protein